MTYFDTLFEQDDLIEPAAHLDLGEGRQEAILGEVHLSR